ncbi:MAG TPA: hypothetical protein VLH15_08750 [Dehalococcoidales bacterium]|nr:hypothetical protein [Dehalococcoidales bacterium]
MGLMKQTNCPLEENYLEVYGIPSPEPWKPEKCLECQYQEDNKCQFKKMTAQQEQFRKRGQPVLAKRVNLSGSAAQRQKAEKEALKKAGFNDEERKEYWVISTQIEISWESTPPPAREELLDHLDQWRVYLEKGLKPGEAYLQVQEWLRQREEFRKGT